MVTKKFGIDFNSQGGALTLHSFEVTDLQGQRGKTLTKEHDSGWIITAEIQEDYYEWINEFEAVHARFGRVWGDFEHEVYADSEEGYQHFYNHHTPEAWDYMDI